MEKIKVAQYFWGSLDAGGAETFIVNLYEKMDREKTAFDFIVYENKEYFYTDKIQAMGGKILPLFSGNPLEERLIVRLFRRWRSLYRVLKVGGYRAFHCNCDFSFKFVEMFIAKKAGVPVRVCHSHNSRLEGVTWKDRVKLFLHRLCIPLLNRYTTCRLACSEEAGKWLFGSGKKDVTIVRNAIDTSKYYYSGKQRADARRRLGFKEKLIVGHIGRFFAVKNHEFLLRIFDEIRKEEPDSKLVLIGEGELKSKIQNQARNAKMEEQVFFAGVTHGVPDFLAAMDVFVMPSLFEGLPVAGVEAQAAGLPCVFSENISREVKIAEDVAFVSLERTAKEWADVALRMAKRERKDTRRALRDRGFDMEECAKKLERLYRSAAAD